MIRDFKPSFEKKSFTLDLELEKELNNWNFPGEDIIIGNNVWIGAGCTILKGVKISDNCIVASGSVVPRGDYPKNSILAGNPVKIVKTLEPV